MNIERVYTLGEALSKCAEGKKPLAGGTNIFVDTKVKGDTGIDYVDVTGIKELKGIKENAEGVEIGALVTFAEAEAYFKGKAQYKALYESAYFMGGPQIRNSATLAGNICDASPVCDAGLALLVLGAEVKAASVRGERRIEIDRFFLDTRKTALLKDEMVISIWVPKKEGNSFFKKVGERNAMTVSTVSVAGKKYEDGSMLFAAGAMAPKPVRLYETEKLLTGKTGFAPAELEDAVSKDTCPIDARGVSKEYRHKALMNMLEGALKKEFNLGTV